MQGTRRMKRSHPFQCYMSVSRRRRSIEKARREEGKKRRERLLKQKRPEEKKSREEEKNTWNSRLEFPSVIISIGLRV